MPDTRTNKELDVDYNYEELLMLARDAQTVFWIALGNLESALGVDVDANRDLEDATVESLLEEGYDEDEMGTYADN